MAHALVLGCGYTGERLALRLLDDGHRVTGSTRRPERAEELRGTVVEPVLLDVSDPESLRELSGLSPDVVFYLVPPLRHADEPGREVGDVIDVLGRAPLDCFVYVSSTSVYGDRDGEWVDETDEPCPDSSTGRARLTAERTVLEKGWSRDARPRIARVAGIYGPGRTLRDAIADGRYHLVEGLDALSNRIHVDDLAAGLVAVWERGENGRVYNLVDDEPHRSADFARRVAEIAGLEIETLRAEEARERYSETRWARKAGSKRVSNRRLREELGVELEHPTWREGVPAALSAEGVEI